ncbi:MAG TPA: radical SAM protein [Gemmataceae bacterium]|nr:radical SAM protein [Gemmataceae bacterium]
MRSPRVAHLAETPLFKSLPPSLPVVRKVTEGRPLLKPGPFAQQPDVMALDFIDGCGHGCPFCPARMVGGGPAFNDINLIAAAERLEDELLALPQRPQAVFVSPSTDPFPPLNDVQQETGQIVDVLARNGIDTWLMTRGFIRPAVLDVLRRHASRVKVTMALTTLDRPLQRMLEPLTAPPSLRLKTIRSLRDAGIACNAALEPLIPNVTDTRENLLPVLEALAQAGVRSVTVGYLVLHHRIEEQLRNVLRPLGLDALMMEEYAGGPTLRSGRGMSGRYLPRSRRQHGYAAVMAMAAGLGLRVGVNALTNPDFTATAQAASPRKAPTMAALQHN